MDILINDLRYAVKMLWKSKGVTLAAMISLAVGIGANSAIFSIVNSLLLRPRPVAHPEQLVELYSGDTEQPYHTTSYPSYLDFRDGNEVFSGLAAYGIRQYKLGGATEVEQIWGEVVSGNYFDVLTREVGRNNEKQVCEVVGVIRDNDWHALQKDTPPFFALAVMQSDFRRMFLIVNTANDPHGLLASVRRTILDLDPKMPVADVQTIGETFSVALYPFRLLAAVMAACGMMALLLATIGIYGVVSYSVAQRTREVGIRMALGAVRGDILRLVVGQGMVLVGYGLGIGLLLGFALTRVLTSSIFFETELLFGVSATDSLTFIGVTLLLAMVALAACYIPALRATKVDPVVALRNS
jgi:hypothetical protein